MARDKKIEEHFPEASVWGVFVQRFRPEEFSSSGDFGLGRNPRYLRPKTSHFPVTVLDPMEVEGRRRRRGRRTTFEWNHSFKFDNSGPLLATAQNCLLHSSLPLCSLLLTNCEGSHSVRLYHAKKKSCLHFRSQCTEKYIFTHQKCVDIHGFTNCNNRHKLGSNFTEIERCQIYLGIFVKSTRISDSLGIIFRQFQIQKL